MRICTPGLRTASLDPADYSFAISCAASMDVIAHGIVSYPPPTRVCTPICSKPAAPHGAHLRMPSSKPSLARYGCPSPDIGLSPNMPNIRRRRQMAFYQPEAAPPCGPIRSPVARFSAARRELHGLRRARSCVLALCGALPVRDASGRLARGAR